MQKLIYLHAPAGKDSLKFLSECLRISKESIFTGLNNLAVNSIMTEAFDEYFGFTQEEVEAMLADYDRSAKIEREDYEAEYREEALPISFTMGQHFVRKPCL